MNSLKLVNAKTAEGLSQKMIVEWTFTGAKKDEKRSLVNTFSKKAIVEMATDLNRPYTGAFKRYVWSNHDYAQWAFINGEMPENPLLTKEEMEKL